MPKLPKRIMCEGIKNPALNTKIAMQFINTWDIDELEEFLKDFYHTDTVFRPGPRAYRLQGYFFTKDLPEHIPDHFVAHADCEIKVDGDKPVIEVWTYVVPHELPF